MSKFTRPEPYVVPPEDLVGFSAGVLRVEWDQPPDSYQITGRAGRLWTAKIVEVRLRMGCINTGEVQKALPGLIVRAPDGVLSRVTGAELFMSMIQVAGSACGILLVPVEEP